MQFVSVILSDVIESDASNMQFFSNVDETNPLVKDVINNIEKHKKGLSIWEQKLKKVKSMY